jgi:biotin carboxyl carrier protein
MRRLTFIHRDGAAAEELRIEWNGSSCTLSRGERAERAQVAALPDGRISLLFEGGRQICGRVLPASGGAVEVVRGPLVHRVLVADPLGDRLAHASALGSGEEEDEEIRAPIPGRVVEVNRTAGERVEAGALLLVLEAMKMQNEIRTARGGTVLRIEAAPGRTVEGGSLLAVLRSRSE